MSKAIGVLPNYYEILEISRDSSQWEIEMRYLDFCTQLNEGNYANVLPNFQDIILDTTRAYQVLSNPILRSNYDKTLDFDVVILDKEIEKTDLREASIAYKKLCANHYDLISIRFNHFKKEMNETLWLIKTTSLFFFINIILSLAVTYSIYNFLITRMNYFPDNFDLKTGMIPLSVIILTFNFILFKFTWQKSTKKKLFSE
jgi:hypothetical protein